MSFHLNCFYHTAKHRVKIKTSYKSVQTIKLPPSQQLMFPYTNDSNANFRHKNAAQGGEQEAEDKFNTKRGIIHLKKLFMSFLR